MTKTDAALPPPVLSAERLRVTHDGRERDARAIPEETAVSFTYGRATYAVMMATPQDLEDFAVGFSLTEGIVRRAGEIAELDVVPLKLGIELRMTLAGARGEALEARRRTMAGPAGCGLCGIESLEAAVRKPARVRGDVRIAPEIVFRAMRDLRARQPLNTETHAVHAAGFWPFDGKGFAAVREDVGRHNALDKLVGALARDGRNAMGGIRRADEPRLHRAGPEGGGGRLPGDRGGLRAHGFRVARGRRGGLDARRRRTRRFLRDLHPQRTDRGPMTATMTTDEKLIYMANQIADFFAAQGETRAVPGIATHIQKFWTRQMREDFLALAAKDDSKLKPLAKKAVPLISAA